MIFYGVDPYFHVKRGRGPKLLKSERGTQKIFAMIFFFTSGPPTRVCERSLKNISTTPWPESLSLREK